MDFETKPLILSESVAYEGLVRIDIPGDGSCYFHAIAKAFFTPYRTGILNGVPISRKTIIENMRSELADYLTFPDENGILLYDKLSKGTLREIAKELPEYSLENMVAELKSNYPVDIIYQELISEVIDKDIYILDEQTGNIVNITNLELFYKNRKSIVLLYTTFHYELIGIRGEDSVIQTLFEPNHPYILQLKSLLKII